MTANDLTALAEAVGIIDHPNTVDIAQWDMIDARNLLIGFPMAFIIGYPTLVAIMTLGGAS